MTENETPAHGCATCGRPRDVHGADWLHPYLSQSPDTAPDVLDEWVSAATAETAWFFGGNADTHDVLTQAIGAVRPLIERDLVDPLRSALDLRPDALPRDIVLLGAFAVRERDTSERKLETIDGYERLAHISGQGATTPEPLIARWDGGVSHDADGTTVQCIAEDGRGVALQLDVEHREALGLALCDPNGEMDQPHGGDATALTAPLVAVLADPGAVPLWDDITPAQVIELACREIRRYAIDPADGDVEAWAELLRDVTTEPGLDTFHAWARELLRRRALPTAAIDPAALAAAFESIIREVGETPVGDPRVLNACTRITNVARAALAEVAPKATAPALPTPDRARQLAEAVWNAEAPHRGFGGGVLWVELSSHKREQLTADMRAVLATLAEPTDDEVSAQAAAHCATHGHHWDAETPAEGDYRLCRVCGVTDEAPAEQRPTVSAAQRRADALMRLLCDGMGSEANARSTADGFIHEITTLMRQRDEARGELDTMRHHRDGLVVAMRSILDNLPAKLSPGHALDRVRGIAENALTVHAPADGAEGGAR